MLPGILADELSFFATPLARTLGLLLVIAGGASLSRAQQLRLGKAAAFGSYHNLVLRAFGYLCIVVGLAAVAVCAIYFSTEAHLDRLASSSYDGLFILMRFAALVVIVFGLFLNWGGKKLAAPYGTSQPGIDYYLGRSVGCLGYFFVECGILLVAIAATELS